MFALIVTRFIVSLQLYDTIQTTFSLVVECDVCWP